MSMLHNCAQCNTPGADLVEYGGETLTLCEGCNPYAMRENLAVMRKALEAISEHDDSEEAHRLSVECAEHAIRTCDTPRCERTPDSIRGTAWDALVTDFVREVQS